MKNTIKICVRADANETIGFGHIYRCKNLTDILSNFAIEAHYYSADLSPVARKALKNYKVVDLPVNSNVDTLDYSTWLKGSEEDDINRLTDSIGDEQYDLLIVDHYHLGKIFEASLRTKVSKIVVLDDLAAVSYTHLRAHET